MIATIRLAIKDPDFDIAQKSEWAAGHPNNRQKIRTDIAQQYTKHFSREQLALIHDLSLIPKAEIGFFSISHCPEVGGYSYSKFQHGFDIERIHRISDPILRRTASEKEYELAPKKYYLWSAKEAAFKALNRSSSSDQNDLLITDLHCVNWKPQYGLDVWSFQIQTNKPVSLNLNRGFLFEEKGLLFSVFFK